MPGIDATESNYSLTIPLNTALRFTIASKHVKLIDSGFYTASAIVTPFGGPVANLSIEIVQTSIPSNFQISLPNTVIGASGFVLGPSVMGHTTAGARRTYAIGDPENAYARPGEPQVTLLLLLITAIILIAIVAILMHQPERELMGGMLPLMALVAVPLVGLCTNALLCATAAG